MDTFTDDVVAVDPRSIDRIVYFPLPEDDRPPAVLVALEARNAGLEHPIDGLIARRRWQKLQTDRVVAYPAVFSTSRRVFTGGVPHFDWQEQTAEEGEA